MPKVASASQHLRKYHAYISTLHAEQYYVTLHTKDELSDAGHPFSSTVYTLSVCVSVVATLSVLTGDGTTMVNPWSSNSCHLHF